MYTDFIALNGIHFEFIDRSINRKRPMITSMLHATLRYDNIHTSLLLRNSSILIYHEIWEQYFITLIINCKRVRANNTRASCRESRVTSVVLRNGWPRTEVATRSRIYYILLSQTLPRSGGHPQKEYRFATADFNVIANGPIAARGSC